MAKRKLTGKGARQKGLQHERNCVNRIKPYCPEAERAMVGSVYDNAGVDIRNAFIRNRELLIQCKRNRGYAPAGKIEEIQIENDGGIKLLWTKADRKRDLVVLYADDFLDILGMLYEREMEGHKGLGGEVPSEQSRESEV